MIDIAREVARVRYPVIAISALSWGVLLAAPRIGVFGHVAFCSATGVTLTTMGSSLPKVLTLPPRSALTAWWALMLVAMMSPLIIAELHHIRLTSFPHRRARSITLFLVGYFGVWMGCGMVLIAIGIAAMTSAHSSYLPATITGLFGCIWQASPFKQRCLNKCHDNRPLCVYGLAADLDAFHFGLTHGLWCVGSCGWLMLFPLVLPEGHLIAMVAVALLVFAERLEDLEPPRWKMRGFGKAIRIARGHLRLCGRMLRRGLASDPAQRSVDRIPL